MSRVTMNRNKAVVLIWATLFFGISSLTLFLLFLFLGSFTLVDLGLDEAQALMADAALSLLFFLQHSIMIRKTTRMRLASLVPDEYYDAFYALSSGIALLAVLLLWQRTPAWAAEADGAFRWLLRALFFLGIAGFAWGEKSLDSFDVFGTQKLKRMMKHKEARIMPLSVRGAYRWVRHPLYLFSLVMIWSCPDLTADRLLFNILWTVWIVVATVLEERDLVSHFGDGYRAYQAEVPMLIPWRMPKGTG
jgi:methanethiol S-methyltransferase